MKKILLLLLLVSNSYYCQNEKIKFEKVNSDFIEDSKFLHLIDLKRDISQSLLYEDFSFLKKYLINNSDIDLIFGKNSPYKKDDKLTKGFYTEVKNSFEKIHSKKKSYNLEFYESDFFEYRNGSKLISVNNDKIKLKNPKIWSKKELLILTMVVSIDTGKERYEIDFEVCITDNGYKIVTQFYFRVK